MRMRSVLNEHASRFLQASHFMNSSVLCVALLSKMICTPRFLGTCPSRSLRKNKNSLALCRLNHLSSTRPVAVSRAINKELVPCHLSSSDMHSHLISWVIGWVKSRAWNWLVSSTLSTKAWSGDTI